MGNKLNIICNECGKRMVMRHGKYGWFWGCSSYPECTNSVNAEPIDNRCPVCNGQLKEEDVYQHSEIFRSSVFRDDYIGRGLFCINDNYLYITEEIGMDWEEVNF